jgi:uncharacterized membrane protein
MNGKISWRTIINLLFLIAIPLITEKMGMSSDVKNAIYIIYGFIVIFIGILILRKRGKI